MEELDVDGLFWLACQPDEKVAGRLKFDAANGAKLNLIGSFHKLPSSGHMTYVTYFSRAMTLCGYLALQAEDYSHWKAAFLLVLQWKCRE